VIALNTAYVPPLPLIVAGAVMIVALYFVFAPVMHTWPFNRRGPGRLASGREPETGPDRPHAPDP
jgi:hypothetical protein